MPGNPLDPDDPRDMDDLHRLAVLVATWRVEGGSGEHAIAAACDLVVEGSIDAGVIALAGAPHDASAGDLGDTIDDVLFEMGTPAEAGESAFDHALRLLAESVTSGGHTPEFLTLWQHRWGVADDERLAPLVLAERWYAVLDQEAERAPVARADLDAAVRLEASALAAGRPSPGAVARLDAAAGDQTGQPPGAS